MSQQEAKWYVVHTYSGYENKVKEDLEKSVENAGLADIILEVKYPTEETIEILPTGKRKTTTRKVFRRSAPRSAAAASAGSWS